MDKFCPVVFAVESFMQMFFIWNIDFNVIRSYVSDFQSGRWP
jgi:hypothetical protein